MPFPDAVERWRDLVRRHAPADLAGDPAFERIALATLMAESGGNPGAVGDQGASVGLFQLHERGLGSGLSRAQRSDPETNASRAVPQLAAAYRASGGDPVRTYVQAINPGATPDGPQVRGVMAAYARGGGGGGGKPLAKPEAQAAPGGATVDQGDRPPSEFEPPSRFAPPASPAGGQPGPTSQARKRIEGQLTEATARLQTARAHLAEVTAAAPAADDVQLLPAEITEQHRRHDLAVRRATDEITVTQNDVERLQKELAAEEDRLAKTPPATATRPTVSTGAGPNERYALVTHPDGRQEWIENPNYTPPTRATRTYQAGGATVSETAPDAGGFQPLPPGVHDPNAITPYQSAELPIQQQHANAASLAATASMLHAQVAQGQLGFEQARTIFDYVVAQHAPVSEGGKLYVAGSEPSDVHRRNLGLPTKEYTVLDAAGFYGRPELNQYVHGPYPFGAGPMSPAEYHARQAGTFQAPGPPQGTGPPAGPPSGPPAGPAAEPPLPPHPTMPGAAPDGGFQPAPPAPPPMARNEPGDLAAQGLAPPAPQMPQFGPDPVGQGQSMIAQQEALQRDLERIVQTLTARGYDPRTAQEAARQYLGAGQSVGQTPY